MSKLENWGDLFKFNKELLDDDFNAGQKFVVKTKHKSDDGLVVSPALTDSLGPEHSHQAGQP
jgi:hypothetical protein